MLVRKNSGLDYIWYILWCIVSVGIIYLIRVVISEAIRQAIVNQECE